MWPNWLSGRFSTLPGSHRSRSFSCSTFKDVQDLCREDTAPDSPRSPSVFHRAQSIGSALRCAFSPLRQPPPPLPNVVVYMTSLRVVRKTFEDCNAVRSILRGLHVPIDERDLSMDASLIDELQRITGRRKLAIPCVFIGGRLIGGAEELQRLHEGGELWDLVGGGGGRISSSSVGSGDCRQCGGLRYVVCDQCDGSRRIYVNQLSGFRSCEVCNVNGLIRCRSCSPSVVLHPPHLGLHINCSRIGTIASCWPSFLPFPIIDSLDWASDRPGVVQSVPSTGETVTWCSHITLPQRRSHLKPSRSVALRANSFMPYILTIRRIQKGSELTRVADLTYKRSCCVLETKNRIGRRALLLSVGRWGPWW